MSSPDSSGAKDTPSWSWNQWNFDVSSLMILLGEQDELNYRLMNRRIVDLFSVAPVAGLQTYLRDRSVIVDALGPSYISPQGGNAPPLRNMRVARLLSHKHLLDDGFVSIYDIQPKSSPGEEEKGIWQRLIKSSRCSLAFAAFIWIIVGCLFVVAFLLDTVTWVGRSNLIGLVGWSLILRITDALSFTPGDHKPSHKDRKYQAIFMGRRHSAFILEGSRAEIAAWTSSGLKLRTFERKDVENDSTKNGIEEETFFGILKATWLGLLITISRIGTLLLLLYVFVSIPNGTSEDQVVFVALNITGQASTYIGQRLHVRRSFKDLKKLEVVKVKSRTEVYAILLRRYGDGQWVDNVGLIPNTLVWDRWRMRMMEDRDADPKDIYDECDAEIKEEEKLNRGSLQQNVAQGNSPECRCKCKCISQRLGRQQVIPQRGDLQQITSQESSY